MTAVENKIPNVSNLVKKIDYDIKVNEIEKKITNYKHDECITTPEFNKLTAENFAARLAQADFVTKADFDNKLLDLNRKIVSNKTKHLIIENELKKLKHLIRIIFVVRVMVMKMVHILVHKIGWYFNQYIGILEQLAIILVLFHRVNIKDF